MPKSPITTHVLDTHRGRPASPIAVTLEFLNQGQWTCLGQSQTNADGRAENLITNGTSLSAGLYRLVFDTAAYFKTQNTQTFFPSVTLCFEVRALTEHYHVPLLLNACGYTTYRGS